MDSARARASFVTWFTCGSENVDHAIGEEAVVTGMSEGSGLYAALCGATVCVASMVSPPGRRCASCQARLLLAERDSPSRRTGFLSKLLGRGRHRDDSAHAQAGVGYRLFGRRQ
jgi:DNA-directed RNA polymerase subunit RPC12/RpoP